MASSWDGRSNKNLSHPSGNKEQTSMPSADQWHADYLKFLRTRKSWFPEYPPVPELEAERDGRSQKKLFKSSDSKKSDEEQTGPSGTTSYKSQSTDKPSDSTSNQWHSKPGFPAASAVSRGVGDEQESKRRRYDDTNIFRDWDSRISAAVATKWQTPKQSEKPNQEQQSKQQTSSADNTNKNVSTKPPRPDSPRSFL